MLKLMYLARRRPGFTVDEFVRRWRRHGALGMQQPLWRFALGYVQSEPIRPAPLAGASQQYDAVASYMVSDDMFSSMTAEDIEGATAMAADELETFAAPIGSVSLWVREEHIQAGDRGSVGAYLFFRPGAAAQECATRLAGRPGLQRLVLNHRDDDANAPDMNALPYAAILEASAPGLAALAAAVGDAPAGLLQAADVAVVTREAVLWDRLPQDCV